MKYPPPRVDNSWYSMEGCAIIVYCPPLQARDIFEEAIWALNRVRDFGQVFDAYAQFEESMINAKMETTAEMGPNEEGACVFAC